MKNCWQSLFFCAFSLSSSQKRQKLATCTHQTLKVCHSLFIWLAVFSVSDTSFVCLSDRPIRWWSLFHSKLKSSCNSVVYCEMVGRQEAASFPPYSFTNHGSCFFFVVFFPLFLPFFFSMFVCAAQDFLSSAALDGPSLNRALCASSRAHLSFQVGA